MPVTSLSVGDPADRSIVTHITQALAERIVSGALVPGEHLRQDHVAAEFRSSHVPVREAFRRLEAQGLVAVAPNRGVRVAPLEPGDVLEVSEMRAALESLALRHAIPRMSTEALDASRALARGYTAATSVAEQITTNQQFHWSLVAPCAMPRLLNSIADLHRASSRQLHAACRLLDWRARSPDEHDTLLSLVAQARRTEARAEAACHLLSEHILAAGRAVSAIIGTPAAPALPAARHG